MNKGLIFIVYLNNVDDGAFECIPGTHGKTEQWTTEVVDEPSVRHLLPLRKRVVGPSGTLVCYDTSLIHRAGPVRNLSTLRKAIFFQVDTAIDNGEQMFVDPSLITAVHPLLSRDQLCTFFGFGLGQGGGTNSYPASNLSEYKAFAQKLCMICYR